MSQLHFPTCLPYTTCLVDDLTQIAVRSVVIIAIRVFLINGSVYGRYVCMPFYSEDSVEVDELDYHILNAVD